MVLLELSGGPCNVKIADPSDEADNEIVIYHEKY
jgi:hypothetical protein